MSPVDPFSSSTPEILSRVVKNLEERWGLTLVSFLPPEAQEGVVQLQYEVSKLWNGQPNAGMREARPYVEFYAAEQLHCTHLTLKRSTPKGPIQRRAFVREGHELFELFEQVQEVTSRIRPIRIELGRMSMSHDRLGVVLLGECADEVSVRERERLLAELNRRLGESFDVSMRSWDSDPEEFGKVHCTLGYLKRPVPQSYETFVEEIGSIEFRPIEFALESVSLVHHRYRSLAYPQEGGMRFPLGQKVEMTASEFACLMNLAP